MEQLTIIHAWDGSFVEVDIEDIIKEELGENQDTDQDEPTDAREDIDQQS